MNLNHPDNDVLPVHQQPGAFLAAEREKRGFSIEQVATKLNLRAQVIASLEADQYEQLPEPVFIQGYIRGYCKYLAIPGDELIEAYLRIRPQMPKQERSLFQNQSRHHRNEGWLFWMTTTFVVIAIVSVSMWLYENKVLEKNPPNQWRQAAKDNITVHAKNVASKVEVKFTDLGKAKELLTTTVDNVNFTAKDLE